MTYAYCDNKLCKISSVEILLPATLPLMFKEVCSIALARVYHTIYDASFITIKFVFVIIDKEESAKFQDFLLVKEA
jgi:hypothetical protein